MPRGQAVGAAWVVIAVGVAGVAFVLALSLVPRVSNGQKLLDALRPVNTAARVHGDRAGINMVSAIVDTEDPIMTPQGGAAAEVPKLVAFVSQKTGLSQAAVLAALQKNFPHTTALLETIPLSSVTTRAARPARVPREDAEDQPDAAARRADDELPGAGPGDHEPAAR